MQIDVCEELADLIDFGEGSGKGTKSKPLVGLTIGAKKRNAPKKREVHQIVANIKATHEPILFKGDFL